MDDEWQIISTAPKDATWIVVRLPNGKEIRSHYACDKSGEFCPPFEGWFQSYESGNTGFYEVYPDPTHWKPIKE